MKLKRFLSLCAVCIFATVLLAGCSSDNTQDTQTPTDTTSSDNSQTDTSSDSQDTSSDSQDTSSDKTEKDTPSVSIPWNEVSDDYEDAAVEAKNEITATDSISVSTLKSLADTIRKDYKVIKDGVTKSNKESAKEMIVTGAKMMALAERSSDVSEEEFILPWYQRKGLCQSASRWWIHFSFRCLLRFRHRAYRNEKTWK